jgi:exosortase/archaeosortase family protein
MVGAVESSTENEEPTALALARRLGPRFALTYAAIAAALFGVYAFPFELFGARGDWLTGYLTAYAHLAGGLLRWFEPGVIVEGTTIYGRFVLQIVRNCDAADVNILFASAVLAFPAPLRKKMAPLLLGLAALVAANVLRICSLYYVGVHRPSWFHAAHEELWPLLLVALTLLAFLACIRHLESPPASHGS